ncbi:cytochrome P450 [Macrophomina phaseolina]|uniref:Cytochrome P450 n=1 Tax=Macrophomina phaseolina TaxID=35725 RepID=A0ABQ8GLL1_9PEZI|nr:cytochrome P450 [Macrophomina phaseolina]
MQILPAIGAIALVLACLYAVSTWTRKRRARPLGARLLPGPRGIPFLGPFWKIPAEGAWIQWCKWAKQYGPIYQVELMGVTHIFVTKESIARELLAKRAAIYSDRPAVPSVVNSKSSVAHGDGAGEYMPFMGKNEFWKRQRKFAHGILSAANREHFNHYPDLESRRFIHDMLQNPANYTQVIENFTSRVMSRLVWANAKHADDLQQSAWDLLVQMSPAGPITNRLTPLLLLPQWLSPWMRKEKKRHDGQQEWFMKLRREIGEEVAEKRALPSFMKSYFDTRDRHQFQDDKEAAYAVGMLGIAGVFTIGSPLHTFLLCMVLFPQWLKPIQQEMDRELGPDRPPEIGDFAKLPMLRAVIMEAVRWRPAVPTGVGHEVEQDDVYDGYFIPKGATVHPVEWAYSRDPAVYHEPDEFNPMRWLEPGSPVYREPLTKYPTIQNHSLFGYGRRACLGQDLTEHILFVGCGALAWATNIRKKRDAAGREIPVPDNSYNSLLIIRPHAFEFELEARSDKHLKIVQDRFSEIPQLDPHVGAE